MDRLVTALLGIVLAVGLSALVFIGINKLFDQAEKRFPVFNTLIGGLTGLLIFGLLWGNRLIVSPALVTAIATAIGAAGGFALGTLRGRRTRFLAGVATGLGLGLLAGSAIRSVAWPAIEPVSALIGVVAGIVPLVLIWVVTGRKYGLVTMILLGAAIGWLAGAWLAADFTGSKIEIMVVAAVLGLLAGAWIGSVGYPDDLTRAAVSDGSRKYIFLGPALLFVFGMLVLPLARTIWLSLQSGSPTNLVYAGFDNYARIFTDPGIINFENWPAIFSSRLFWAALVAVQIGVGIGLWLGRKSGSGLGTGFSMTAGTVLLVGVGVTLLAFAVFTNIRGTIANNLWWIFSVTLFSVALGLAVAVIADRSRGENAAKSMIFLPLSISFVGASIIWRGPMYTARPPTQEQTGVLNSIWVQMGEWSSSDVASAVVAAVLGAIALGIAYIGWRGWRSGSNSILAGSVALVLPLLWLIYRFLGPGIGGVIVNPANGEIIADPVIFLTGSPWNNWWMMVVFIWIQTGFAMVIFSAAIKAVPGELLEAARIDGATESQTFWRVTIPQILPTIGVVTTTLMVTVLKVFDIPKVMTNGNFDTQVLANEMWQRAFTELNFGLGSALAVIIFLGVLPIMYLNIRRMQRERLG